MKKRIGLILSILLVLIFGGIIIAQTITTNKLYRGYEAVSSTVKGKINTGGTLLSDNRIDVVFEHNVCKKIINTSSTAIFVPTKTDLERNQFRNNLPPNTTLASCGCYTSADCALGEICQGTIPATDPSCQGTFTISSTTSFCRSEQVPSSAFKCIGPSGNLIFGSSKTECEANGGTFGFYLGSTFHPVPGNVCMYNMNNPDEMTCYYPCNSFNQSQCTSYPGKCTWTTSSSNTTYDCDQPITTSTSRCVGKTVPSASQHCWDTSNWNTIAAPNPLECRLLGYTRGFYFNSNFYAALNYCMYHFDNENNMTCYYPCWGLTQAQCNSFSTQCSRTTTTTTVDPGECGSRSGCSRGGGSPAIPGTCVTGLYCGYRNGNTYFSLASTSEGLCTGGTATNFVVGSLGWTRKCGTSSCSANSQSINPVRCLIGYTEQPCPEMCLDPFQNCPCIRDSVDDSICCCPDNLIDPIPTSCSGIGDDMPCVQAYGNGSCCLSNGTCSQQVGGRWPVCL